MNEDIHLHPNDLFTSQDEDVDIFPTDLITDRELPDTNLDIEHIINNDSKMNMNTGKSLFDKEFDMLESTVREIGWKEASDVVLEPSTNMQFSVPDSSEFQNDHVIVVSDDTTKTSDSIFMPEQQSEPFDWTQTHIDDKREQKVSLLDDNDIHVYESTNKNNEIIDPIIQQPIINSRPQSQSLSTWLITGNNRPINTLSSSLNIIDSQNLISKKIKKPLTAYFQFLAAHRERVKNEHGLKGITDVARVLAEEWKRLSEDEKRVYRDLTEKDKIRYSTERKQQLLLLQQQQQLLNQSSRNKILGPNDINNSNNTTKNIYLNGDPLTVTPSIEMHCLLQFPMARIKRIIQRDPDMKYISRNALISCTKATEQFVSYIAQETLRTANIFKKKTLSLQFFMMTLDRVSKFEFIKGLFKPNHIQRALSTHPSIESKSYDDVKIESNKTRKNIMKSNLGSTKKSGTSILGKVKLLDNALPIDYYAKTHETSSSSNSQSTEFTTNTISSPSPSKRSQRLLAKKSKTISTKPQKTSLRFNSQSIKNTNKRKSVDINYYEKDGKKHAKITSFLKNHQ